jgi:hypothetical protein
VLTINAGIGVVLANPNQGLDIQVFDHDMIRTYQQNVLQCFAKEEVH